MSNRIGKRSCLSVYIEHQWQQHKFSISTIPQMLALASVCLKSYLMILGDYLASAGLFLSSMKFIRLLFDINLRLFVSTYSNLELEDKFRISRWQTRLITQHICCFFGTQRIIHKTHPNLWFEFD